MVDGLGNNPVEVVFDGGNNLSAPILQRHGLARSIDLGTLAAVLVSVAIPALSLLGVLIPVTGLSAPTPRAV